MLTIKSQEELDRRINNFAERSFRDIADGDYIAARLACRAQLMDQFKWSAQQAIEKYFKYILLVNRIPASNIGHDIGKALALTIDVPFEIELDSQSKEFFTYIGDFGEDRYLTHSWHIMGLVLPIFDKAIWQLRRYCQVLDVRGKILPEDEQKLLLSNISELKNSSKNPPHKFKLKNGFLETVLEDGEHPARAALLWQNAYFGNSHRKSIRAKDFFQAKNSPLYLYPQMHVELAKYVYIKKPIARQCEEMVKNDHKS
jgi:hypothetical protein